MRSRAGFARWSDSLLAAALLGIVCGICGLCCRGLSAAERIAVDLEIVPSAGTNAIALTIEGDVLGTVKSDSKTVPVEGNMLATLGLAIDPTTYEVQDVQSIELTGGRISIGDASFRLDWGFLVGRLDIVSDGVGGTFDTPNPPGPVAGGSFDAIDHEVILDEGSFSATGSGLLGGFMPENPYAIDLAQQPTTVNTEATGTIEVILVSATPTAITYDVIVTLPLEMDEVVLEEPGQATMRIKGTTTLDARGRIVLVPDFGRGPLPAWTGVEEAALNATSFTRGAGDEEVEWSAESLQVTTFAGVVGGFTDPENPRNLRQFQLNDASVTIATERIDVRGSTGTEISVGLRTWDTSSGFEADDGITLTVLMSTNGVLFEEKPWTAIRGAAATALNKGRDGAFTTFRTPSGFIPGDVTTVRLVIAANTNSNSEHIFWDDIRVSRAVRFRRGDCDASAVVDIADPVRTLVWLFRGADIPSCLDACDSNDDGLANVSDALFTLGWLFSGGPIPPAPGPRACGLDATPATSASCESYTVCSTIPIDPPIEIEPPIELHRRVEPD